MSMKDPRTKSLKLHKQSGFTIVESIVAMIVGTIMIGSAILILTSGQRLGQRHRDLIVANAFVEQKVEALRSTGFLGLTNGTTAITSEMPAELNSPRSGSLQISTPSSGLKKIDLSITYNEQGTNRTYTYTTYIGELGVGQY
ncbi:type II secretion system protein [Candidatus Saccharibacteria bacterium]|nr:type II secretion system protein [Candidatus Saccharibacteria bacterium]MBI2285263.1 type II secretion system protein [Candidatus Saccharibacteria bacterium]